MKIKKPAFLLEAEKKLKVIWDLLKNTDAIRFRLTVTMYREKGEEPVVMTMEGTRAENGGWNLEPPPSKRAGPLESPAELKEKLGAIEASINKYISAHSLDEKWREWLDALKEAMKSGRSTEDLEFRSEIPVRAIASYGYGAHFFAPVMAMAYVLEGTDALARGDLDQASRSVERGVYWSRDEMLIVDPTRRFTERAGTGGTATGLLREPVKKKVAELLKSLAPEEGWRSTQIAIDTVASDLNDNHSRDVESCHLKLENLPRTIKQWLDDEPERFPHSVKSRESKA